MTRQEAFKRVVKKYGDVWPVGSLVLVKNALMWYDDDILDDMWEDHISSIVQAYKYVNLEMRLD